MPDLRVFPNLLVAIVLLVPVLAWGPSDANAQDKRGFGFNGGIGVSSIRDQDGIEVFKGNSLGYNLGIEYRFVPAFAVGFDAFSLGQAEDFFDGQDTRIRVRGYEFFARGILAASEKVDAYARIGAATYFADVQPGFVFDPFGQGALSLGAGLDISTTDKLSVRLEGRYFRGDRDETGGLLTVGFYYLF